MLAGQNLPYLPGERWRGIYRINRDTLARQFARTRINSDPDILPTGRGRPGLHVQLEAAAGRVGLRCQFTQELKKRV